MDFSDYLILSDFDLTIYDKDHDPEVSTENVEAIRYFTENGGRFSLCTGRYGKHFAENPPPFIINAPLVGLSGAEIYDIPTKTRLFSKPLDCDVMEMAHEFLKLPLQQTIELNTSDSWYRAKGTEAVEEMIRAHEGETIYKLLSWNSYTGEGYYPPVVDEFCRGKAHPLSNCANGFEIIHYSVDKGITAKRLKEMLGAKRLIGVGDFEGDIPLIEAADVGYAVANATDAVKAHADRVTGDVWHDSIARIIRDIEAGLCK